MTDISPKSLGIRQMSILTLRMWIWWNTTALACLLLPLEGDFKASFKGKDIFFQDRNTH